MFKALRFRTIVFGMRVLSQWQPERGSVHKTMACVPDVAHSLWQLPFLELACQHLFLSGEL